MYKETTMGTNREGSTLAYRVKEGDPLYTIYFKGGGQIPECLSGMWNDVRQIEAAITGYLNRDKLCAPDQVKKDYKDSVNASKRRPSKLKQKQKINKVASDAS